MSFDTRAKGCSRIEPGVFSASDYKRGYAARTLEKSLLNNKLNKGLLWDVATNIIPHWETEVSLNFRDSNLRIKMKKNRRNSRISAIV